MRLGFVGVGKHAQRMASAFRECGAEIVAFDRFHVPPNCEVQLGAASSARGHLITATGLWNDVRYQPWLEQVAAHDIGAIVCCAPPTVTAEVAGQCAKASKRCVATKPLKWEQDWRPLPSLLYVDLWRLYSPAWLALKADLQGKEIRSVHVDFYGNGPVRASHSGLLDYGPHALAFILDLGLKPELSWQLGEEDTYRGQRKQWVAGGYFSTQTKEEQRSVVTAKRPAPISIATGNCGAGPMMYVRVDTTDGESRIWCEEQTGKQSYLKREADGVCGSSVPLLECSRDLALRNFCRGFLAGDPSETLRISCDAMKLLRQAEPW